MPRLATLLLLGMLGFQTEKGVIEGMVRTAGTDAPIVGADVTAVAAGRSALIVKTDSEGHFTFSVVPGTYRLSAAQPGYVSQALGQRSATSFGTAIRIEAGNKLTGVTFRLVPTGTIVGRVYDPEGKPLEGASISVSKRGWDADGHRTLVSFGLNMNIRGATTNDLGEYRIYYLPPGEYYVSAKDNKGGFIPGPVIESNRIQKYATTYYPGLIDPSQASAVNVAPGVEVRGIDFSVTTTHMVTVRGRVVTPPASSDAVTNLFMSPVDPASFAEHGPISYNNAAQTFSIPNVMAGRYRLVAALRIPNDHNLSGETFIDVGEDPVDNVTVSVVPGQTIRGKVSFEDSPATVKELLQSKKLLAALRGEPGLGFIDTSSEIREDGTFTLPDVGTVTYRVGVFGMPPDFYVSSARMNGVDLFARGGLRLASVVPGPLEISVSGLGGQIDGRIVDPQNEGIPDARALLIPAEPLRYRHELFRMTPSDGGGYFNIRGIPPGEYKLIALDELPSGAQYDPDFLRPLEARAKSFKVEKNDRIEIGVTIARPAGVVERNFSGAVKKR